MRRIPTGFPGPGRGLAATGPLLGFPLLAVLLVALLLAACGSDEQAPEASASAAESPAVAEVAEPEDPFPVPPQAERAEPDLPKIQDLPRSQRERHAMLISDEVLMEWKLEIVQDELAPDPGSAATQVLILASLNDSTQVSMASLKALTERLEEADVRAHLVWMLDDERWERRAWAARALGQGGSDELVPALEARLARESENRVRRQLDAAIESLRSHTAEAEVPAGQGEAGG